VPGGLGAERLERPAARGLRNVIERSAVPTIWDAEQAPMSKNSELILAGYEALRRGDLNAAVSMLDERVEWQDQSALPGAQTHRGRDAVRRHLQGWLEAWDAIEYEPREVLTPGDYVIVVLARRGRGRASGAAGEDEVVHVFEVREQKVKRFRGYSKRSEAVEAVGLRE
jgi:ketosteroid isomerase-like protein